MATIKQHFDTDQLQFRSSSPFPMLVKADGTAAPVTGLAYDASIEQSSFIRTTAVNYGSGNLTISLKWYADTALSGGVTWGVSIAAVTPNVDTQDIETKAFATETTFSDTHLGTVGQRPHEVIGTLSNLDSLALDDIVMFRISRKPGDAGDTMAGYVILIMADIWYSDT